MSDDGLTNNDDSNGNEAGSEVEPPRKPLRVMNMCPTRAR